jgi:hypothetical protein
MRRLRTAGTSPLAAFAVVTRILRRFLRLLVQGRAIAREPWVGSTAPGSESEASRPVLKSSSRALTFSRDREAVVSELEAFCAILKPLSRD